MRDTDVTSAPERYFNVSIETSGTDFTAITNWMYYFDGSTGTSSDETGSDTFTGTWDPSTGTATVESNYARIVFDEFYISNDNKAEYAIGTFYWISGEIETIGLMRY